MFLSRYIPARFTAKAIALLILLSGLSSCVTTTSLNGGNRKQKSDVVYKKYAEIFGYELTGKEPPDLLSYLSGWLGTPYKYGGNSKSGTDCSGFTSTVYLEFYKIKLYRSSAEQLKNVKIIGNEELEAGDLLFFKINGTSVSHVGLYLSRNRFIHASTKRGVVINSLEEEYYKKYYFSGGRVIGR